MAEGKKIRFALIGGGEGAFIGAVHRLAAEMDGQAELVAGCFASDGARSKRAGQALYGLPEARCYVDVAALLEGEAALPLDRRTQFIVISTPNHTHFGIASAALEAGFHVVCDKPMVLSSGEAQQLAEQVRGSGLEFAVTYNYTGYPMVNEARELIRRGSLGAIRRVQCSYLQGWLAEPEEASGNKQAEWRTDPSRSGVAVR